MSDKRVEDKFMVLNIEERDTKSGKSKYFYLTLSDGNTTISAKKWNSNQLNDHDKDKYEEFLQSKGKVVKIIGKKEEYKGKKQIILTDLHILENEDTKKYIPQTKRDSDKMKKEFDTIVESINNKMIKNVLKEIFNDETREKFFQAPAAKSYHHNFIGGLAEHTLQIIRMGEKIVEVYGEDKINKDLLIAGILLHDIGKIVEYSNELGNITNTDEGKLVGHIVIGSELVEKAFEKIIKGKKDSFYKKIADKVVDFRGNVLKSKKDRAGLFQLLENIYDNMSVNKELYKDIFKKKFDEKYKEKFSSFIFDGTAIKDNSSKKGLFGSDKNKNYSNDSFQEFFKQIRDLSFNFFRKAQENYYLKLKIKHIILAHHGQREFGAPIVPKTIEAYIVHMLDNLDAKTKKYFDLKKENSDEKWSSYERMFNSEMFLK